MDDNIEEEVEKFNRDPVIQKLRCENAIIHRSDMIIVTDLRLERGGKLI
jgi:hypothetical protein